MNVEEVREKLDKLAVLDSPDAVAMELEAQGVVASPGCASHCAIAHYLGNPEKVDFSKDFVAVTHQWVAVYEGDPKPGVAWERNPRLAAHVAVPDVVRQFIRKFDDGEYPALVDGTWHSVDDGKNWP